MAHVYAACTGVYSETVIYEHMRWAGPSIDALLAAGALVCVGKFAGPIGNACASRA
jgi:hypothetical protein